MRCALLSLVVLVLGVQLAQAQQTAACRVLCTPEFKVEPTITFTSLFGSPRTIADNGTLTRERRETEFELILSLGLPTHCQSEPCCEWLRRIDQLRKAA
jgi:hypothetical protein